MGSHMSYRVLTPDRRSEESLSAVEEVQHRYYTISTMLLTMYLPVVTAYFNFLNGRGPWQD